MIYSQCCFKKLKTKQRYCPKCNHVCWIIKITQKQIDKVAAILRKLK